MTENIYYSFIIQLNIVLRITLCRNNWTFKAETRFLKYIIPWEIGIKPPRNDNKPPRNVKCKLFCPNFIGIFQRKMCQNKNWICEDDFYIKLKSNLILNVETHKYMNLTVQSRVCKQFRHFKLKLNLKKIQTRKPRFRKPRIHFGVYNF